MKIFDIFTETDYAFLRVNRGNVYGNTVGEVLAGRKGVFREKSGMKRGTNGEVFTQSSTLFVRQEDLPDDAVGNGVKIGEKTYNIVAMSEGKNFSTGEIEHLKLTLEREEFNAG